MAITIQQFDPMGLEIQATGKLTRDEFAAIRAEVGRVLAEQPGGKLLVLFETREFTGWTLGGVWEEFRFDWLHFDAIEKLAMVGDRLVDEGAAAFPHPFPAQQVAYFAPDAKKQAYEWLRGNPAANPASQRHMTP